MRTEHARTEAARPSKTLLPNRTTLFIAAVIILCGALWFVGQVLLVLAAGVFLAVALSAFANFLVDRGVRRRGVAIGIIVGGTGAVIAATGWLLAPEISSQTDVLMDQVPQAWHDVVDSLRRWGWGRTLLRPPEQRETLAMVSNATGMAGSAIETIARFGIVLFVGVYLAANPDPYRRGLLRLLPPEHRRRASEVLDALGVALQRWLLSRLFAMVVVASTTAIGLWLLGIQLALTLGLLSGILTFVPYLGAIVSTVPAVLLAATHGLMPAVYVVALYIGVHVVEGYLVTPLIEQQAVWLPPGLSIAAQVILWTVAGGWGIALASPIAATLVVLVNMLYIEDQFGETAAVPTNGEGGLR